MQQTQPAEKRYVLALACGHSRRTDFPPMGYIYPCAECPLSEPSPEVETYTDTVTGITKQLRTAPAA